RPPEDAAGFDIDYGVQASTLEYCYSHENEGDVYLLMGSGEALYNGYRNHDEYNIMRYCVGEGNTSVDLIETFKHGKVYNNFFAVRDKGPPAVDGGGWVDKPSQNVDMGGGWPSDTEVFNNIFYAMGEASALWVDDYATRQGNSFDHNLYWMESKAQPLARWAG